MAGTSAGARKRVAKTLAEDPDFFSKLGAKGKKGGKLSPGSFTSETASLAGAKGKRKKRLVDSVRPAQAKSVENITVVKIKAQ
ncbi:MAG: hypothetical protein E6R04_09800 [Spirochaetes bacterium]|nr:MAG: hypothetical protein E6R04_09800 [Spirochaetota bacterium]